MISLKRVTSDDADFVTLVRLLDAELNVIDGAEHAFYAQFNKIDKIKHVVVAYENDTPVACGAIKIFDENTMEVKRMYTSEGCRGNGIASKVLIELEIWAREMNYEKCVLETGVRQPDAIRLYEKNGYCSIPNYGQYINMENSCCFEKLLT